MNRFSTILIIVLIHLFPAFAQRGTDESVVVLDTVTVRSFRNGQSVLTMTDGNAVINMPLLDAMPKIMGNTDPISFSRLLPGVQTTSDGNGSLHINGSENGHNMISVLDVPIYNVNHMLGFFSAFIPTHYSTMSLYRNPQSAGAPNRLGGELEFRPFMEDVNAKPSGDVMVGLLFSEGTFRIPTGKKSLLTVSLRDTYINMLYSRWLTMDQLAMKYSFFDSNLTWSCKLDDRNTILADTYWGQDKARANEPGFIADISCRWGNDAESVHWIHERKNGFRMKQTLYRSSFFNDVAISHNRGRFSAPSSVSDLGYKGMVGWKIVSLGADVLYHDIKLQAPLLDGTYNKTNTTVPRKSAWEYSLYNDYSFLIRDRLSMRLGVRANLFDCSGKQYHSLDPSLTATYYGSERRWSVSLSVSQRNQYLFQTGLSAMGLPTEFWMPADKDNRPQSMNGITLSGMKDFDAGYTFNASLYYRKLFNQLEYYGSLIDVVASDFEVNDHLIKGDGYNYGFDMMLSKNGGSLTGWIAYSYGRALRRFDREGMDRYHSASHERLYELDATAVYKTGRRWEPSVVLVAAGGTPFTAPEYFYLLDRKLFVKYGDFNGNRVKPYLRLDLSVNYSFKVPRNSRLRSHGINFSVYNVLGRNNELGYRLKVYERHFYYHPVSFITIPLPSLSYYCKF